ncbi:hypothetical protein [Agarilytica rhodophyticola]|uniref:hypothetical protein n=1 Tax=Agarilytica rhodophyticola TaxID=1737490 RepID=UPI000B34818C|nr:hypothetical protein [Agarilytica rhodophyticola]
MWKSLLNLLNGALGERNIESGERIPEDEEVFPDGGIIRAPSFEGLPFSKEVPYGGVRSEDHGEVYEIIIGVGYQIYGGQSLLLADFGQCSVEIPSPCSGIVEEVLTEPGNLIK